MEKDFVLKYGILKRSILKGCVLSDSILKGSILSDRRILVLSDGKGWGRVERCRFFEDIGYNGN